MRVPSSAFLIYRKHRVVLGEQSSSWCDIDSDPTRVNSRASTFFNIYVNDLPDNLTHTFKLYNGKLLVELGTYRDNDDMRNDIDKIVCGSRLGLWN